MKYSVVAMMEPGGQKNTYVYVVVPSTWYKDGKCWYPRSLKATSNLKDLVFKLGKPEPTWSLLDAVLVSQTGE